MKRYSSLGQPCDAGDDQARQTGADRAASAAHARPCCFGNAAREHAYLLVRQMVDREAGVLELAPNVDGRKHCIDLSSKLRQRAADERIIEGRGPVLSGLQQPRAERFALAQTEGERDRRLLLRLIDDQIVRLDDRISGLLGCSHANPPFSKWPITLV